MNKNYCYKITSVSLIFLAVLLLSSCSSELTPNIENFSRAINTELHKNEICFEDPDFVFPRTVLSGNKPGEKLIAKFDALHAAKLISRVKSKRKPIAKK